MNRKDRSRKKLEKERPLFFEGFEDRDEFEAALRRLERFFAILDRWDRQQKVNLDLEEPSRN